MKLQLLNGATVEQTTSIMNALVERHKTDVQVRIDVADIVRSHRLRDGDVRGLCDAVYQWVRARVRYWKDTAGVETIQSPNITLALGIGDCDDLSVLAATILQAAGVKTNWLLIGYTADYPEHVCVCCYDDDSNMHVVDCSCSPCELQHVTDGATLMAIL